VVYAGTVHRDGGELAVSRDGGRSWQTLTPWRTIGPDDARSGGSESGRRRTLEEERQAAVMTTGPGGILYVGTERAGVPVRVFASADQGRTWVSAALPSEDGMERSMVTAMAVSPIDTDIVLAATRDLEWVRRGREHLPQHRPWRDLAAFPQPARRPGTCDSPCN
jgi:hypothetical protein